MWRGSSMYFSIKMRSSAKLDLGLARRGAKPVARLLVRGGDAHPLAAAAGRRLDHDRIADVAGDPDRRLGIRHDIEMPGHGRHPGGARQLFRFDLVAHRRDRLRPRPDKDNAGFGQRLGKGHILGQKPVARMHRLGAAGAARLDDPLDREIALGRRRRPDPDRLVGHAYMQGLGIGVGINRNRGDPHPPCRANDTASNLAAIGDQDFAKHHRCQLSRPTAQALAHTTSSSWPGLSRPSTEALLPVRCAGIFLRWLEPGFTS